MFGRLKARWQCLMKRLEVKPDNVAMIIMACCVLHNVCEIHGEEFDDMWLEDNKNHPYPQPDNEISSNTTQENHTSEAIRDTLIKHFKK